ncbi:hypothetical protein P175DRAFT_0426716 [Aspergillus ochraceoroseus IBT 24754]|uniref:FAD-binding domain-containing protein n=2 Tax=Aspergillus ochraceoroseus TaxID=138278 RepID=A0A2T5MA62_9EURO|nr:uncharacterized protein P175DRAFT_0426716 [Aspergillus ochraceoroseus IBT 24754]KKK12336.1 hypothetical protein AOCH_004277 [Aspergillus ochraceoroseus]PTU25417.1 hypothetical protein P175DRAFT_0426716 [Aspergillus ochraceoroseus IBT 24754]
MKIVIIGGGISGCAAYLELRKHLPKPPQPDKQHEITIYEAYDTSIDTTPEDRDGSTHSSTLVVGGGLGVAPNGLGVLKRLDENLLRDIVRGGYAIAHQDLRAKNGVLLMSIDSTGNPDADGNRMHLLGTSRHSLWKNLRLRIPNSDIMTKRVSKVVARPNGRNVVHFENGSPSVEADLVIGADGIKGVTKHALFPQYKEDLYAPQYQGLVGVGGFLPVEETQDLVQAGTMNLVFGGNGFFGYFFMESSPSAPDRDSPYHVSAPGGSLGWWSTYAVDECPDPKSLDMGAVSRQLRERHENWKDPVIRTILRSLHVSNMYPTWTSPQLPTWQSDGVVLVGDAAHALPSTSGQGSSQALEDVEAFILLLSHHLREVDHSHSPDTMAYKNIITTAAKQYMEMRQPRIQRILESAQQMQNSKRNMGVLAEYAMYCMMWIAGFFPSMLTKSVQEVFNYNVAEDVENTISSSTRNF